MGRVYRLGHRCGLPLVLGTSLPFGQSSPPSPLLTTPSTGTLASICTQPLSSQWNPYRPLATFAARHHLLPVTSLQPSSPPLSPLRARGRGPNSPLLEAEGRQIPKLGILGVPSPHSSRPLEPTKSGASRFPPPPPRKVIPVRPRFCDAEPSSAQ